MNRLQKASVLTFLADRLLKQGNWAGETHIQKAIYFLQELFGVDTEFGFILYKHGPFSFDLRDEISNLNADRLLVLDPQPYPYGPSLVPTPRSRELWEHFPKTLAKHEASIETVAEFLDKKGVSELERLATALYVLREEPNLPADLRASRIQELKPHVSGDQALRAVSKLERFIERAARTRESVPC